ncbi:MAG: LodA/GoxA family CTQ-dependent oxidase, partial [Geminicoccaceae bacterium]
NKKAQWYQFQAALDIPDAVAMTVPRRNPSIPIADRKQLAIDPGPRSASGKSVFGGEEHLFDTGKFKDTVVPLGEIRTDEAGRLLVLGGTGTSASPSGAPVYIPSDPSSFNNADDWYDDTADGPVMADVSISGRAIPVEAAWVVVTPPNYAPNIVGWRTLHELLVDVYVQCGWMQMPDEVSFVRDVLPVLRRQSNLQWVNHGFATMFGKGGPMDSDDEDFIAKLAQAPDPATRSDPYAELRQVIFNSFLPSYPKVRQPPTWPRLWPWIYGDAFGSFAADSPDNNLALPAVQKVLLERWVQGDFINDWPPKKPPATSLDQVPLAERPAMLDRAALHFCLADAFHPGCEMTWPMRHATMYDKPFRIRHRPPDRPEPDYGTTLDQQIALQPGGPLYAQAPGDITRWMALPWQGDTAFCRSGYELDYDPYVPTFWPARVPNQVLTEEDYQTVIDTSLPREARIAAFNHRPSWLRPVTEPSAPAPQVMMRMIAHFGALGVVEARQGVKDDPDFPDVMYVESFGASPLKAAAMQVSRLLAAPPRPLTRYERAGWADEAQYHEFRRIRVRHQ